jgi:hypothetical protein
VHRHPPRAVPAQDRYGQQGEPGFAAEHHGGPGHADGIGAAQTLHQGRAAGDQQSRGHQGRARAGAFEQRPDHGQQRRDAGNRDAEDGGFGVLGALDQREVEHHQPGHRDTGQPQPLRPARHAQPTAGHPGERDQEQAGHGVSHRLGSEHRRPRERGRDRDAAAHADHGCGSRGHAGHRFPPRRGLGRHVAAPPGHGGATGNVGRANGNVRGANGNLRGAKTWHPATLRVRWSSE